MDYLEENGYRVLHGVPGGAEKDRTETLDFIRFTYKGFVHVLYGTGGHKTTITDYYRKFVLRNAEQFLVMIDLSEELEPQLEFLKDLKIPTRSVTMCFNKFDLAPNNLNNYKSEVIHFFNNDLKKNVKDPIYPTIAIESDDKYQKYNDNCHTAILSLCSKQKKDAFAVWDNQ